MDDRSAFLDDRKWEQIFGRKKHEKKRIGCLYLVPERAEGTRGQTQATQPLPHGGPSGQAWTPKSLDLGPPQGLFHIAQNSKGVLDHY